MVQEALRGVATVHPALAVQDQTPAAAAVMAQMEGGPAVQVAPVAAAAVDNL